MGRGQEVCVAPAKYRVPYCCTTCHESPLIGPPMAFSGSSSWPNWLAQVWDSQWDRTVPINNLGLGGIAAWDNEHPRFKLA